MAIFILMQYHKNSEPKQRKSSLATAPTKTEQRKKSVTMVVERNETVEFVNQLSCDETEEANVDNSDPGSSSG